MKRKMPSFFYFTIILLEIMVITFGNVVADQSDLWIESEKLSWTEKTVELQNGIQLEYVEQGSPSGTPILLLHGWTDSWNSFERVLPLFPESYHVVAPTLRGHGDSDKPLEGYCPKDFSRDVELFMDALNLDKAIFVGFSMGGVISKRFALDYPERVAGLVLIGTPVNLDRQPYVDDLWELLLTLEDPIDPEFVRSFNAGVPVKPVPAEFMEHINQANMKVPAHVWRDAFKGVWDTDMLDDLTTITVPALVLWGDQDSFTTIDDQKELASAISNSEFKVYQGNGHAIHWEDPEQFSTDVIEFVERKIQ